MEILNSVDAFEEEKIGEKSTAEGLAIRFNARSR